MYLYRQTPSGQSRVHQVSQWRTDSVYCRESSNTGQLVFEVIPVTGVPFRYQQGPIIVRLLFPTPIIAIGDMYCTIQKVSEEKWPAGVAVIHTSRSAAGVAESSRLHMVLIYLLTASPPGVALSRFMSRSLLWNTPSSVSRSE